MSRSALFALTVSLLIPTAYAAPTPVSGVPRFVVVNDRLARGGQPSGEGFRSLAAAGYRTVIDLQEQGDRSRDEKHLVEALGMKYVNVPMRGMKTPEDKQISRVLRAIQKDKDGPIFVHCKRGADRTGVVLAVYRIECDRWANGDALQEARDLGMSWYQIPLQRYIQSYRPHGHRDSVIDAAAGAVDKLKTLPSSVTDIFR